MWDEALEFTVPPDILTQEFEGESILLNLATETYFGLDDVGTRMWQLIQENQNLEAIFAELLNEYDVEESVLRSDLTALIEKLAAHGLLQIQTSVQADNKLS